MSEYTKLQAEEEEKHHHGPAKRNIPPEEINTGPEGLSSAEAKRRLERDGLNSLPEIKKNPWLVFLSYYWGPMPCMIWISVIIEGIRIGTEEEKAGAIADFVILLLLQFLNGFIGWKEEKNAGNAIEALKNAMAPKANVKRDGQYMTIDSKLVVVGDRLHLKLGDIVSADAILGPGFAEMDQAALTGESLAVMKYEGDEVYQGSVVKRGDLEAIVCATGANTFFGRTSNLVASVEARSNFQKLLMNVTMFLFVISVVLVIIIFIVVLNKGEDFLQTLSLCVIILVASIPMAMNVVCATTLAVGARALARRKAIVSRLNSIEELASMSILCSDKTGTLTKNELTVKEPRTMPGWNLKDIYLYATLACKRGDGQDAIDKCICQTAFNNVNFDLKIDHYEEEDFVPFDPKIKRTEATVRNTQTGETFKCTKGAPQVILAMTEDESLYEQVSAWVNELAAGGYRTIGVAKTDQHGKWVYIGLIPLYDPPRDDTAETIKKALHMEVSVKMITGDQTAIAKEVSRELGLGTNIYNSELLSETATVVQKEMLDSIIVGADGFAEVFPEHKFAIVKILQDKGYRVGMTGDGVNDAPALKKADVGIAVEGATDAARAAADIVLTLPGLSVIIEAIYRSRKIFQRMMNYVTYRIACTFQLLLFFFITMVSINPDSDFNCSGDGCDLPETFALPVISLVIITVLNDGTIITIAYDNVTVSKKPETWNLWIIYANALLLAAIAFVSSIGLLLLALDHMDEDDPNVILDAFGIDTLAYGEVLTIMYLKVSISDFLTVFTARTKSWFWTRKPGMSLLIAALLSLIIATVLSMCWFLKLGGDMPDMMSIDWRVTGFVWFVNLIFFFLQDLAKIVLFHILDTYYESKGMEKSSSRQVLTDSFLIFTTGVEKGGARRSIVTRRSIAAAHEQVRGSQLKK